MLPGREGKEGKGGRVSRWNAWIEGDGKHTEGTRLREGKGGGLQDLRNPIQ